MSHGVNKPMYDIRKKWGGAKRMSWMKTKTKRVCEGGGRNVGGRGEGRMDYRVCGMIDDGCDDDDFVLYER